MEVAELMAFVVEWCELYHVLVSYCGIASAFSNESQTFELNLNLALKLNKSLIEILAYANYNWIVYDSMSMGRKFMIDWRIDEFTLQWDAMRDAMEC